MSNTCCRWVRTVVHETDSSSEISLRLEPREIRRATSASAFVRPWSRRISAALGSGSCSGSMISTKALASLDVSSFQRDAAAARERHRAVLPDGRSQAKDWPPRILEPSSTSATRCSYRSNACFSPRCVLSGYAGPSSSRTMASDDSLSDHLQGSAKVGVAVGEVRESAVRA